MLQKIKFIFTTFILTSFIFTAYCSAQQKVIKNIKPATWKVESIVPGQSSLYGQGKYTITAASPVLLKGLMLYDDYKNKRSPFTLEFEAGENITVYAFMRGNKSKWSAWPGSKAFIKWAFIKNGKKKISKYLMRYKKFPQGKVTLNYQPDPKAGTRPFFIITSKSLHLQKRATAKNSSVEKPEMKLISLKKGAKAVTIDGTINNREWEGAEKISLYLAGLSVKKVSANLPQEKTDIFISRDKNNLYIGAKCYKNDGNIILAKIKNNVVSLWQDECFEVYFQPKKASAKYTQIMINSLGYYYITGKASAEEKNAKLKIKTKKYSDRWEVELVIPLKLFSAAELMGINFSRTTYDSRQKIQERTAWSTVKYNDINNYGTLFLAGNNEKYNRETVKDLQARHREKIKKAADSYKNLEESPYNHFMLWPEPKFIKKYKGSIRLDRLKITDLAQAPNTASLLTAELKKKYNFIFKPQSKYSLTLSLLNNAKIQQILKKHRLQNKLTGKNPDSFIIIISDTGVLVTGNNNRGIYYGVRAFLNIVDHSTATGKAPAADFMTISDWPDQKMRLLFWRMDSITREAKPDINMIKHYLYNTIAGTRYNGVVFMMRDGLQYKSAPKVRNRSAFTAEEFKDLVAFCRKQYLEPIPSMNTPGHGSWIIRRHKELAELNNTTLCTRNPASLKLIFDIADELIELCGGVGKVKYFHVGKDEIRWENNDRKNKRIKDECHFCKGTPWKDLLLEYIKREHAFFTKRGIRMMMWSDMFYKERNGAHYETYKILKDLPRDIILSPWSSAGYPPLGKWKEMGFDVIKGATGYKVVSTFDDISMGHMFAVFTRDQWMTFNIGRLSSHNYYNHLSEYIYGSNAWNNDLTLKPRNQDEWDNLKTTVQKRGEAKKLKFLMEYGNALTYFYSKKRFPAETDKFKAIDISAYCNVERENCFKAGDMFDLSGLKSGKQLIAGIPTQIGEKIIVLHNNSVKNIKISAKASSILFLYAAYLDPEKEQAFKKRIRRKPDFQIVNKRSPIAYYLIKYNDGSVEKVTMNYGFNVGALRPPLHSRYTYDIRHVHRAAPKDQNWPEVKDCRDCSPGAPATYQYEWVNPHPGKKIASMDFISMNSEVIPALIALTVRETK
jgi:glycosyl hydrolase family 20/cellulose/xylan binding protein with CBM9 domain